MEAETKADVVTPNPKPSLHRRILPYYLDNYVKERPVIFSAGLPSTSQSHLPEERRPETCSLPLRGIDYSQTSLGVDKLYANTHRCPPGDDMCDLCKRHFAKRQPDGYKTFLNHIFTHMGHRTELKQNAKRYIIQKPHPHLPAFVSSKFLHPKIFWREVRKPREKTHQQFHGRSRTPKTFHYHRTYRTNFNRCPNSPETTLDSTGIFENFNEQTSDNTIDTNATRRKSVGKSRSRKKKTRARSSHDKKSKSKSNERDKESESGSDDELTDSDGEDGLQGGTGSSRKGIAKKEKKQRYPERKTKEEDEESTLSDENLSNISEKNSNGDNVEIKIDMKLPELPRYQPKPPQPMRRNSTKQKMFLTPKQQPNNNSVTNKTPPTSMFSFFGQTSKGDNVDKNKLYSWLQRQFDFSLRACRFELPIDGRVLENVTPEEYLRRYCVVTPQFQSLYQKVFRKYQSSHLMKINFKDLEIALRDVAVNNFSHEKMKIVQTMTGVDEETSIDYKLFCGIAALTERVSSDQTTRLEMLEKSEDQQISKERIETADFSALDWKLKNIEIGEKMKCILWTICS